ncbi:MAG TPA: hypothetical protein VFO18_02740 [Methylomirabilota bacterium]|nr:hypothetical protein [Methylomirabilota bacterium]
MARRLITLWLAALLAGCAVAPLPKSQALRDQSERDQRWDAQDCREDAEDASGYDSTNSPGANLLAKLFFWSTAGAALGGTITGIPRTVEGPATEGLVAGAGAGAIAGGTHAWLSPQSKFERAYIQCMEARGYRIVPKSLPPPPSDTAPLP